jgi:hydrogenase nickel incorporation protein HypA/HybF
MGNYLHELSICSALLDQVTALAALRGADAVNRVTIEVGPLCGVDPALLCAAFAVLRTGSCAAQADLSIDTMDVRVRCNTCDATSAALPNRLACPLCGSFRTRILQGDELRLRRVELSMPPAPMAALACAPSPMP